MLRGVSFGEVNGAVKVVASPEAVEFIREHGGRLYVWADLLRCTGPKCTFLAASVDAPEDPHEFRRFGGGDFEIYFSDEGLESPATLKLALAGWRKKSIDVLGTGSTPAAEDRE